MAQLLISPEEPLLEEFELPNYSDIGNILFRVVWVYEDRSLELEILDYDGSVFWINEGTGADYWLQENFGPEDISDPDLYVVEGITGYYHRGCWGFDDDWEEWSFKSLRPATAEEIAGECLSGNPKPA